MTIYNGEYTIYCHINKINGKKYIGQTKLRPEIRWGSNGCKYKECRHFWYAIQKYGWDNFEHVIIAEHLTLEEANHFEELLINKLHLTDGKYGYNLSSGGENKIASLETKELWRKQRKGNSPFAKKTICDGIIFSSMTDCASYLGIERNLLKMYLNKNHRMPKEFIERGLNYLDNPQEFEEQLSNPFARGNNPRAKKVICDEIIFDCARDCADYLNINYHTMINWLFHYKPMPRAFYERGLKFLDDEKEIEVQKPKEHIVVICEGKRFDRITDFVKQYGVAIKVVSKWASDKTKIPKEFLEKGIEVFREVST